MEAISEHIKSGEYFRDAREWYAQKYLLPIFERSYVALLAITVIIIVLISGLTIYSTFPLSKQLQYTANISGQEDSRVITDKADAIYDNARLSLALELCKLYVIDRENYDGNKLREQMIYIFKNSTRGVFKEFNNEIQFTNPHSIALRYKKRITRSVTVNDFALLEGGGFRIYFSSLAKEKDGTIVEQAKWAVDIEYKMDEINPNMQNNQRFGFLVTGYNKTLIKDNLANQATKQGA